MTVTILGQQIEAVTLDQAVDQVMALAGHGGFVVTMNVDHAVLLEREAGLQDAYRLANHRYADGMPVLWLSRLLKTPLPARVTGADFFPAVLAEAAARDLSVHLVGGTAQAGRAARERALELYPSLRWTGQEHPPRGFERSARQDAAVVASVAAHRPDIVFVCLGAPKQEEWAARHTVALAGLVLLCTGAAVDFFAGTVVRAPNWVQRGGLEWAYRLLREPRRLWRRYLVQDVRFIALAAGDLRRARQAGAAQGLQSGKKRAAGDD